MPVCKYHARWLGDSGLPDGPTGRPLPGPLVGLLVTTGAEGLGDIIGTVGLGDVVVPDVPVVSVVNGGADAP